VPRRAARDAKLIRCVDKFIRDMRGDNIIIATKVSPFDLSSCGDGEDKENV